MGVLRDNLEPTDFADAVCRVTDWHPHPHFGMTAYRIWLCNNSGHWFQRHEWAVEGRNQTRLDEWLYSGFSKTRGFGAAPHDGLQLMKDLEL